MGIFSRLFGNDDVLKKAAEGTYNGVDMAFFTKEEKALHFLDLLKAYEPFKLAQRLLMLVICPAYVLGQCIAGAVFIVGLLAPMCEPDALCKADHLMQGAQALSSMINGTLGQGFAIILAFYFGGGAVEGVVRAAVNRKD